MTPDQLEVEGHALVARGHSLLADAAKLRTTTAPTIYSTAPGGTLPPGRSRRWLREHAEEIGCTRVGGKRGRSVAWLVTREQYDAWLARPAPKATTTTSKVVIPIDAMIAKSGYRATRAQR